MARAYTKVSIERLAGVVQNPPKGTPLSTTIQAAEILLNRGWGRPHQTIGGEDGKAIEITIRKMMEG